MKTLSVGLAACAVLAACGRPASKPEGTAPATVAASTPAAPSKPAPGGSELVAGLGNVHHPIKTSKPEAQKFFDQGVALAFGFNHEAAIRSFERAQQLDPKAAMAYCGEAWALGTNYNLPVDDAREKLAFDKISEARALATDGPQIERDYIDAMARRYSADMKADRTALERKYSAAMGELSRHYPDDLDAATLYAESMMNLNPWKLWSSDGKAAPGTDRIVSVLESVLKRDPNHLGANHFYIHAVEASGDPGRALPSAARLDTAAPASGHIVHMPAHIYARTGDQTGSARANAAGVAADEKYLATAPPGGMYDLIYYSHNLSFLADAEMMRGRFKDALQRAQLLTKRLDGNASAAMFPMMESMVVGPISVLLRFNKDDEVLALPEPAADKPVRVAWWHFARGIALTRAGKTVEAMSERTALMKAAAQIPDDQLWGGLGFTSARAAMDLAAVVLDARLAWAKGAHDIAIQRWRHAVATEDKLPYDEPPAWYYPMRESLGGALLMAGKPTDAEQVFREDLLRNPRNPRSLFGLQAALKQQGKDADAAWIEREFEEAWRNADTQLAIEGL